MSPIDHKPRVLYLLIEESDREFQSRCLIASIAARRGFDVVIGPQWPMWDQLDRLRPGVMLFKGNNRIQTLNMHRAKHAGHLVASIEEEVLGLSDEVEVRHHYAPGVEAGCDLFLVQGLFHARCLERHGPGFANRSEIVGNPRADLLRAPFSDKLRAQAAELRHQHGEFVLLNTNFGAINPTDGDSLTFYNRSVQVAMVDPGKPEDIAYFKDRIRWERDNAKAMIAFTRSLLERRPATNIILRPHPAERVDRWRRYLGENSPIKVILEGSHLPWTLASDVMIHAGCTTGFEAALLDTPTLSLMPGENPWHASAISNIANPTARSSNEACERVISHLDGHRPGLLEEMHECDYSYFLHHDNNTLAANRIVGALAKLGERLSRSTVPWHEPAGAEPVKPLQAWQSRKYDITLDRARRTVDAMTAALGYSGTLDVDSFSGGAVFVRAT
jgi:surface carbohydrate biosynthesis protein